MDNKKPKKSMKQLREEKKAAGLVAITRKYRVLGDKKDFLLLDKMSRDVNYVWNYCNEMSAKANSAWMFQGAPGLDTFDLANKQLKKKNKKPVIVTRLKDVDKTPVAVNVARDDELEPIYLTKGIVNEFDYHKMLAGTTELLSISSGAALATASQFCKDRKAKFDKIGLGKAKPVKNGNAPLKFRSFVKSQPWIPIKGADMRVDLDKKTLTYRKHSFKLAGNNITGNNMKPTVAKFIKDGGKWYVSISFNIVGYESTRKPMVRIERPIGLDVGVKTMAVDDDGISYEVKLGKVKVFGKEMDLDKAIAFIQSRISKHKLRTGYSKQVNVGGKTLVVNTKPVKLPSGRLKFPRKSKKLSMLEGIFMKLTVQKKARIEYQHYEHIMKLLKKSNEIVIGNVSGKFLQKKHGKKSASNSLGLFKTRLAWMCKKYGVSYKEVKEAYSTVTCNKCGSETGPSGLKDLSVRNWTCSACGENHDRDTNAARNILKFHLDELAKIV